jgi:NhaP-type Na+/H+ or K+/H+ antiporter
LGEHQAGSLGAVGSNPSSSTIRILQNADFKMEKAWWGILVLWLFRRRIHITGVLAIIVAPLYIKNGRPEIGSEKKLQ